MITSYIRAPDSGSLFRLLVRPVVVVIRCQGDEAAAVDVLSAGAAESVAEAVLLLAAAAETTAAAASEK